MMYDAASWEATSSAKAAAGLLARDEAARPQVSCIASVEPSVAVEGLHACSDCALRQGCLAAGLSANEEARLMDALHFPANPMARKATLFRTGQPAEYLYLLRSGTVKCSYLSRDGSEQVLGFHFPGELVGLDALAGSVYRATATALERTFVCRVSLSKLMTLAAQMPALQRQVTRLIGAHILADQQLLVLRGKESSEARLAMFLLDLSQRYRGRNPADGEFRLPMSRQDIGKYLALTVETVSRLFTRLRQKELIAAELRQVRLLDIAGLQQLTGEYR